MPAMCFILVKDYTIIGQGDDRRGRYFLNNFIRYFKICKFKGKQTCISNRIIQYFQLSTVIGKIYRVPIQ